MNRASDFYFDLALSLSQAQAELNRITTVVQSVNNHGIVSETGSVAEVLCGPVPVVEPSKS